MSLIREYQLTAVAEPTKTYSSLKASTIAPQEYAQDSAVNGWKSRSLYNRIAKDLV